MNKRFEKLIEYRKLRGYTQKRMAEFMNICTPTYTGWETGLSKPDIYELKKLAEILHTTTDSLLDETPISQEIISSAENSVFKMQLTPKQVDSIKETIDILNLVLKNKS